VIRTAFNELRLSWRLMDLWPKESHKANHLMAKNS
jgi:hypothetical protein